MLFPHCYVAIIGIASKLVLAAPVPSSNPSTPHNTGEHPSLPQSPSHSPIGSLTNLPASPWVRDQVEEYQQNLLQSIDRGRTPSPTPPANTRGPDRQNIRSSLPLRSDTLPPSQARMENTATHFWTELEPYEQGDILRRLHGLRLNLPSRSLNLQDSVARVLTRDLYDEAMLYQNTDRLVDAIRRLSDRSR